MAENFISAKFRWQQRLHFWLAALLKARCLLACYFEKQHSRMTSLISGHKIEIRKSQSERHPPRVISDFFAKARKVFNKGHREIISKESNVSPPLYVYPFISLLCSKRQTSTHTHKRKQQPKRRKKKKEPEILVTPHVVFICEK